MNFLQFYLTLLVIFSATVVIFTQKSALRTRPEKKCKENQTLVTDGCESPCGPMCKDGFIVKHWVCESSCFRGCRCSFGYVERGRFCISTKDCRAMKIGSSTIDRREYQIISN